jgi:hypothetical protein
VFSAPAPHRVLPLAAVALVTAAAPGCARVVDAVVIQDCATDPTSAGCAPTPWPIAGHSANSDPWLVSHRTVITELRPRVLVLNFQNGVTAAESMQAAMRQAAALAEGSRYHGYADAAAPVFLRYEIAKVVDLTDDPAPAGWTFPSSTQLPTAQSGEFDVLALFSARFADTYGFTDPSAPERALSLCELFERGVINEVWIQDGEPDVRRAPLYLERKQTYDTTETAVPGSFAPCIGGSGGCLDQIICGVTVRLAHLDSARGPGCDLQVRGWGIERMWDALPSLRADALAFLNRDFDRRFGVRFDGWAAICDQMGLPCVTYPTPQSATGRYADGAQWTITSFRQGCGSTQFPPNATARWDVEQDEPVDSRCEHFGLRDAADGGDTYEPYTAAKAAAANQQFPDCGGGWQIYWRQSIPGAGNRARSADGTAMKNWWPLLFY